MNAREHSELAAHLTEQAQTHFDDEQRRLAHQTATLAQAHALTSIALSLAERPILLTGQELAG